jgi:hypothetical protein
MKKKNFAFIATAIAIVAICGATFTACEGEDENYYNLSATGSIYADGEQTVTLSISEYATSESKTTFKESITANDVTLSGVLEGKTVKELTYISETSVSLVLDGSVTADSSHAEEYGTITVARSALANNSSGNCYARVNYNPVATANTSKGNYTKPDGVTYFNYSTTLSLPYGSFIEENVNTENITVIAGDAEVSISLEDNTNTNKKDLKIYVKGYNPYYFGADTYYQYPTAHISANVTTFNVDLYIEVGKAETYSLKSST